MPKPRSLKRFGTLAKRLGRGEDGHTVVYVTLSAGVILGMIGLALDGSRAMITHSEAQAAADAAALAAASQLDGQAGACARAKAAATSVTNAQRFAEGGGAPVTIASGSPVCLSGLPTSDSAATTGFVTTSDPASRYVQVTTQQLTHQNTFLAALTTQNTALIQRSAVAGFRRSLCSASPVMMACNTLSWTPGVVFEAWDNKGGSLKGWLNSDGCGNANCVHDELAQLQPAFCVVDNSLEPATGNKTNKAADGYNTRFGEKSTSEFPSDLNITSYPRDNSTGTPGWDCAAYFNANHASDGLMSQKPAGCTANATSVTRYSIYQLERSANKIPAAGQPKPGTKTTPVERRLAYLAVFDCSNGGPPAGFIKAFMIEPAKGTSSKTAFLEPLGLSTSKTDPTAIHEEVQLYR